MAAAFLAALCGHPDPVVTFQTFDDSPAKAPQLARVFHGTLEQHAATLAKLNGQGAGVFVNVNETDLQGRKARNQLAPRALCVDCDKGAPEGWALEPSILVLSARGPHPYWLLQPGAQLADFVPALKHLAAFYDADPKATQITQVMRVPGFWHTKATPFFVLLEHASDTRRTIAQILEAHPLSVLTQASPEPTPLPLPLPRNARPYAGELPPLSERVWRATRYLERMPASVAGQRGHDRAFAAAIVLGRGLCLPYEDALDVFRNDFNPRCNPPWSPTECEHKIRSAIEDGRVPMGYLLNTDTGGESRIPRPMRSSTMRSNPAPAAAPASEPEHRNDPRKTVEAAIAAGVKAQELAPLIAAVPDPITRDELVAQVSHLRNVGKGVLSGEVKRHRRQLRRGLHAVNTEPPAPSDAPKPTILVQAGRLHEIVLEAEAALLASPGPAIYRRSGQLVRVIRGESFSVRGIERPQGALVISALECAYLQSRMTGAATWLKEDARRGDLVACDAPVRIAEVLQASHGDWKAPALVGTIEAPTLRPDGSILETPGYDVATGLLYDPGDTVFPPIPESPTLEDAQAALKPLLQLLGGFPFVSPVDRSAVMAAMLTALVRKSLPSAPLFTFSAPKMRSGKSLLADLGAMLATGRPCAMLSQAGDPEEDRKRLLAVLIKGDSVVVIDNVEHPLGGAVLCQILTQEAIQDRILGDTRMVTAPTSVTMYATGNNLIIEGDLTSRVVPCVIDPAMERPEERDFPLDLYTYVPRHRGKLVAAALTILRAYHVAGRPSVGIPRWGGFDAWSSLVRSSLVWVGMPDPAAGRSRAEALDPVRSGLKAFLVAWFDAVGPRGLTLSDLVRESEADGRSALRETLAEICPQKNGAYNIRSLGKYLKSYVNRVEGGYRLVRLGLDRNSSAVWGVAEVHSPQNPSESAGSAGSAGSVSSDVGKLSGLSTCDTLGDLGETFPATPRTPRRPENAEVTLQGSPPGPPQAPPFVCPDCSHTRSRPSASSGRPLCVMCWPSPEVS